MLKCVRVGKDWRVLSGNLEIAEIWTFPNGHFGLKVHGVYFAPDGTSNTRGGMTTQSFPKMIDAYVNAGYQFGLHGNEIKS